MRKIIISIFTFVFITSASFAIDGGFEFILNVPIGMSIGIYDYDLTHYGENQDIVQGGAIRNSVGRNSGIGFDVGASIQLGYMFKSADNMGFSMLGEIGYSHDTFSFISKISKNIYETYTFDSLQIGIIPKFNIKNFAIGLGVGVKIPFIGNKHTKTSLIETDTKLTFDDIKRTFKVAAMPYLKLAFDYSIFFTERTAFNIGLYLGCDFGLKPNLYGIDESIDSNNRLIIDDIIYSSFDIGLQLGFKFGPNTK